MRDPKPKIVVALVAVAVLIAATMLERTPAYPAPFPPSPVIADMTFDGSTHRFAAPETDNWPVTWADDDSQYTAGGDGDGFEGSERSSLIVSRIEGEKTTYQGTDIWESARSGNGPTDGKSYGILSVDGDLYMWVSPGSDATGYRYAKVWMSTDNGRSWTDPGWQFDGLDAFGGGDHGFINPTFLQFGPDYRGARDDYVYVYANELDYTSSLAVQRSGEVSLMRVPRTQIAARSAYEFFAGLDSYGPVWRTDIRQRQPVFQDDNGVGWNLSVSYNAPLERYFLITEHTESFESNIGVFDAPTPWGPWTTVLYEKWSVPGTGERSHFYWNFSNRWLSEDGKQFVLISTGIGTQDRWNSVEGRFVTADRAPFAAARR